MYVTGSYFLAPCFAIQKPWRPYPYYIYSVLRPELKMPTSMFAYGLSLDGVTEGWTWFLLGVYAISAAVIFVQTITRTPLRARVFRHLSLVALSLAATYYLAVAVTYGEPGLFGPHFFYLRFGLW
jgi:hypothetical protein